jgi:hypothetical protein
MPALCMLHACCVHALTRTEHACCVHARTLRACCVHALSALLLIGRVHHVRVHAWPGAAPLSMLCLRMLPARSDTR